MARGGTHGTAPRNTCFVKLLCIVVNLTLYFIPKLSVYDHKLTSSELRPDEEGAQDGHYL